MRPRRHASQHEWITDSKGGTQPILVGGKEVRGKMKEFNARRVVGTLRGLRERGQGLTRRISETADDILKHVPFVRRRSSAAHSTKAIADALQASDKAKMEEATDGPTATMH